MNENLFLSSFSGNSSETFLKYLINYGTRNSLSLPTNSVYKTFNISRYLFCNTDFIILFMKILTLLVQAISLPTDLLIILVQFSKNKKNSKSSISLGWKILFTMTV